MSTSTLSIVAASPLGSPVPSFLPHAVSVSLPTWQDNVDYEEGAPRVVDVMKTGYPRFFIHRSIQKLSAMCEAKFGLDERAMLFPCDKYANSCRDFIIRNEPKATVRIVQFYISPPEARVTSTRAGVSSPVVTGQRTTSNGVKSGPSPTSNAGATERPVLCGDLHIVLFKQEQWGLAKAFWQHTGTGISSRLAEHCLQLLEQQTMSKDELLASAKEASLRGRNRHYSAKSRSSLSSPVLSDADRKREAVREEETSYLEERYGRNLPALAVKEAKRTLRERIAGVISECRNGQTCQPGMVGPSTRRVANLSADDVFLFPGGMCAIWHTHQLLLKALGDRKSICWGFPYVDTLKILQKWGPGCFFFGHGDEFEELEVLLKTQQEAGSPILALFCECTSNPLLRTPDLARLRLLADEYKFALVVDETVGNFANVEVLPYADVVCSSLTKVFSGETNVMGGGLILNPQGQFYRRLRPVLESFYEDTYWGEDALFLERNSRNFKSRVYKINQNAEDVCDLLYAHSLDGAASSEGKSLTVTKIPVIKKLYYPKWITTDLYNSLKTPQGGFGGLFSVTFTSEAAARAFFDALGCEKGPSLGTNFTLACPFVILAHYTELDWARGYGVDPYLVRVSVGLEKTEVLIGWIENALRAAESAIVEQGKSANLA
ncbi:Probable cystathionine gamma-synthase; AltName: Full=O-succinylhomoserine (thiol)-lyase [Serendipita indica DSM 11827]|nr:Probable cystathionine gamma-synthase; AltName: Full=O-succinylhomoserine (thiol)-lyase [Serendipita indica DSM 11827]